MLIVLTAALLHASVAAYMGHHLPPPHNLLHVGAHLENEQFLYFAGDVNQQFGYLVVISDPVIFIVDNLVSQHSGYFLLV